jgi:hypothetical protein
VGSGGRSSADQARRRFGQRYAPLRLVLFLVLLIAGSAARGAMTGYADPANVLVVGFDFPAADIPIISTSSIFRSHSA